MRGIQSGFVVLSLVGVVVMAGRPAGQEPPLREPTIGDVIGDNLATAFESYQAINQGI